MEPLNAAMYWAEIDRLAREALAAEHDGQDADDALVYSVDAHRWVAYAYYALQVPLFSRSCDDDLVTSADLSAVWRESGLAGVASTIAAACLLADARDRLAELRSEQVDA